MRTDFFRGASTELLIFEMPKTWLGSTLACKAAALTSSSVIIRRTHWSCLVTTIHLFVEEADEEYKAAFMASRDEASVVEHWCQTENISIIKKPVQKIEPMQWQRLPSELLIAEGNSRNERCLKGQRQHHNTQKELVVSTHWSDKDLNSWNDRSTNLLFDWTCKVHGTKDIFRPIVSKWWPGEYRPAILETKADFPTPDAPRNMILKQRCLLNDEDSVKSCSSESISLEPVIEKRRLQFMSNWIFSTMKQTPVRERRILASLPANHTSNIIFSIPTTTPTKYGATGNASGTPKSPSESKAREFANHFELIPELARTPRALHTTPVPFRLSSSKLKRHTLKSIRDLQKSPALQLSTFFRETLSFSSDKAMPAVTQRILDSHLSHPQNVCFFLTSDGCI